jgi:hypothetical protein
MIVMTLQILEDQHILILATPLDIDFDLTKTRYVSDNICLVEHVSKILPPPKNDCCLADGLSIKRTNYGFQRRWKFMR